MRKNSDLFATENKIIPIFVAKSIVYLMNYPLISEYIDAIKFAEDNFAELSYLRPVLGDDGSPVMTSGNFAVVFKMKDERDGKCYAVKCFTKEQEGRAEAYRQIAEELKKVNSPYLTSVTYLEKELFVDTDQTQDEEFPVLLMDWVEGKTLDKYLRENLDDQYTLEMLAYRFSQLAQWLIPQPFAHGDLKPDNILVREDGSLVLVDYDGMYVPSMKGQKARELGSPDFRHPKRTEDDFDEHIDDFPLVSILASLKGVAMDPNLLEDFGAVDRLLFSCKDYHDFKNSRLLKDFYPSPDDEWNRIIDLLVISIQEQTNFILSPNLPCVSKPSGTFIIDDFNDYNWDVSEDDIEHAWDDKFGAKYSSDKKRLLWVPIGLKKYTIRKGTKVIGANAFEDCEDLLSVEIPNSVTKIGPEAFMNCTSLHHITIPFGVICIGDRAFNGCSELHSIDVPESITEVEDEVFEETPWFTNQEDGILYIGKVAYKYIGDKINLKTIEIRDDTTEIGNHAFSDCVSLVKIHIPDSVRRIGIQAFAGCQALERMEIPEHLESIGQYAFYGCSNLVDINIPNSMSFIPHGLFSGCI